MRLRRWRRSVRRSSCRRRGRPARSASALVEQAEVHLARAAPRSAARTSARARGIRPPARGTRSRSRGRIRSGCAREVGDPAQIPSAPGVVAPHRRARTCSRSRAAATRRVASVARYSRATRPANTRAGSESGLLREDRRVAPCRCTRGRGRARRPSSARWQTKVPPRFNRRSTRIPRASSALRRDLAQDHLLREVLRPDPDRALRRRHGTQPTSQEDRDPPRRFTARAAASTTAAEQPVGAQRRGPARGRHRAGEDQPVVHDRDAAVDENAQPSRADRRRDRGQPDRDDRRRCARPRGRPAARAAARPSAQALARSHARAPIAASTTAGSTERNPGVACCAGSEGERTRRARRWRSGRRSPR